MTEHKLIIVTPIYEDLEASSLLFKELATEFSQDVFVVAVDDGSVQQPLEIDSLQNAGIGGVILKLRRNVGHQRAIAIGLDYVSQHIQPEQSVVVMDSDGEDRPSTIPDLLEQLQSDQVDVVVAERKSRVGTFRFKVFYFLYKNLFSLMTGRAISFGNFMALKADAVKRLVLMQETSIHVAASVLASKLRLSNCPIHRGPRYAGQSKMNFVGLALHGFRGMMVFAEDVLVRVGTFCAIVAMISLFVMPIPLALKAIGMASPGWASVLSGVLMLVFIQTGTLTLLTLLIAGLTKFNLLRQDYEEVVVETYTVESTNVE